MGFRNPTVPELLSFWLYITKDIDSGVFRKGTAKRYVVENIAVAC